MLGQRRRRWANIKTSLFQRVVFAGMTAWILSNIYHYVVMQQQAEVEVYFCYNQLLLFVFE